MPRPTKTETTRQDGRRALTVYMFPDMIRDLKNASLRDADGRYAYEIVEEAVRDWLLKNEGR